MFVTGNVVCAKGMMGNPFSMLSLTISSVTEETRLLEEWFLWLSLRDKDEKSLSLPSLSLPDDLDICGMDSILEREERRILGRNINTGDTEALLGAERQLVEWDGLIVLLARVPSDRLFGLLL